MVDFKLWGGLFICIQIIFYFSCLILTVFPFFQLLKSNYHYFLYTFKDVQSENPMFTVEICKYWNEVHWYACEWYIDCTKSKILYSKLDHLEHTFVEATIPPKKSPYRERMEKNTQVYELSKDNAIISVEPSSKKCNVFQRVTSSHIDHIFPTDL